MSTHRRCSKCRAIKDHTAFCVDRSRPAGISYVCKACRARPVRAGRPSAAQRAGRMRIGEQWCTGCKAWLAADLVVRNNRCRACLRAYERERYASDPKYRQERRQHAHARRRGVDPVPVEGQERLMHSFCGQCAYCPSPATTWDHVIPISKGGRTTPDNILPCCVSCNASKGNRDLFRWLDQTGRIPQIKTIEHLAHHQVLDYDEH